MSKKNRTILIAGFLTILLILSIFSTNGFYSQGICRQQAAEIQKNLSSLNIRLEQLENRVNMKDTELIVAKGNANESKYDIFRDVLGFNIALIAAIGGILYFVIKTLVWKNVEKNISSLWGRIYLTNGLQCYSIYQMNKDKNIGRLKKAIEYSEKAFKERLLERDKILIKNNLAYYYTELYTKMDKKIKIDKKRILEFAEFVYEKYNPLLVDYDNPEWVDTYFFVNINLEEDLQKKEMFKQEIRTLINNPDLQNIQNNLTSYLV